MEPFLRWAGGKRWLSKDLSPILSEYLSSSHGVYYEPFLGAGAIYFALAPQKSILSDINTNLIETYSAICESSSRVQEVMKKWNVDKKTYYHVRNLESDCRFERSAQFIWLNRTCYGGLYRENRQGQFNVPFGGGSRTPDLLYKNNILDRAISVLRQNTQLICADFELVMERAKKRDVIYCDPTYSNVKRENFDRYGKHIFSWSDQVRLARSAQRAFEKGVLVIVSNGFFDDLVPLYPKAYRIIRHRKKHIGKRISKNKTNKEYLIILDPLERKALWEKIGKIEINCNLKRQYSSDITVAA
jgi:DNA adenine methylase